MSGKALAIELQHEVRTTTKILERVPTEDFSWKPHEKSMTLGRLAGHIAEIPNFISYALTTDELDLAAGTIQLFTPVSSEQLLQAFKDNYEKALHHLNNSNDEMLQKKWQLRIGEKVVLDLPAKAVIRTLAISHMIHHRGQLSVYLRLLNIPVPAIYGPSADELSF